MKTKLYKMWIKHSKKFHQPELADSIDLSDGSKIGYVSFNYKLDNIKITQPSPAYDAWCACMNSQDPLCITKFIASNFNMFKDVFPLTCVFLDLHQIEIKDVLASEDSDLVHELIKTLACDAKNWENQRIRDRRCMTK